MCLCLSRHVQQPASKSEKVLNSPALVVRGLILFLSLNQVPFVFCFPPTSRLRWEEDKGS